MDPTATTDLLEETWRSIIAVGQELSEENWERATDCPGWSVKDHVSHVIGTERMLQGLPPADVELGDAPHVKNAIGEFNEREAEVRREQSGAEVLAELEELADLRLATLRSGDEAYFAQERMTPTGPGTMLDFLSIRILDCWVHEQDIRRAVDRPGHMGGGPAEHTIDRLVLTIPIVVGKRAAAPEGSTTVIEITGPVWTPVVVGGRAKVVDGADAGARRHVTMDTGRSWCSRSAVRRPAAGRADHHRRHRPRPGRRRQPQHDDLDLRRHPPLRFGWLLASLGNASGALRCARPSPAHRARTALGRSVTLARYSWRVLAQSGRRQLSRVVLRHRADRTLAARLARCVDHVGRPRLNVDVEPFGLVDQEATASVSSTTTGSTISWTWSRRPAAAPWSASGPCGPGQRAHLVRGQAGLAPGSSSDT
jgi:uncharacterized protein (TIGR03083 family)